MITIARKSKKIKLPGRVQRRIPKEATEDISTLEFL